MAYGFEQLMETLTVWPEVQSGPASTTVPSRDRKTVFAS
jgi:hypothetical protein